MCVRTVWLNSLHNTDTSSHNGNHINQYILKQYSCNLYAFKHLATGTMIKQIYVTTTWSHNMFLLKCYVALQPLCLSLSLETISISSWARLYHHISLLSVFSHVSCQFVFGHIFSGVVGRSQSRSPPSSIPRYDHVHHFS